MWSWRRTRLAETRCRAKARKGRVSSKHPDAPQCFCFLDSFASGVNLEAM